MTKNNISMISIEVPPETIKKIEKNKGIKGAIGAIADVVIGMQKDIDKSLLDINEKKGK